jgi:asparagine synthetase B (glutamine-hydrolysing)
MCGIYFHIKKYTKDTYKTDVANRNLLLIDSITKSLSNRGPDDNGYWYDYKSNNDILAVQTRLKINGEIHSLPLIKDNHLLLVNGEIYNYKELSEKFNFDSSKYKSDCEVLIDLYILLKRENKLDDFNSHLNGQYSFIVLVQVIFFHQGIILELIVFIMDFLKTLFIYHLV